MPVPFWLANPKNEKSLYFWSRVLIKGVVLYLLVNMCFGLLDVMPALDRVSLYNQAVPGYERFPPGGTFKLPILFQNHAIAQAKAADEYRVILLGDSATHGSFLTVDAMLSGTLNATQYQLTDGRTVRVYNLAYPYTSLSRDLMLLDYAMQYDPDMIIWLVTKMAFFDDQTIESKLVRHNPDAMRRLIATYDLSFDPDHPAFVESVRASTLVGQRHALYWWFFRQVQSIQWGMTGIDVFWYNFVYEPRDVPEDIIEPDAELFVTPPNDPTSEYDVVLAALNRVGTVPLLMINEPLLIAEGLNADIYYNRHTTRVTYDQFRIDLGEFTHQYAIPYLDLWDVIPQSEFLDTPMHYSAVGAELLAVEVGPAIVALAEGK